MLVGSALENGVRALEWGSIESAWLRYVDEPNRENAESLCRLIPRHAKIAKGDYENWHRVVNLIKGKLDVLEKQVAKGRETSLQLVFHLLEISDGAFAEELIFIIGNSIKKHPRQFLRTLSQFPHRIEGRTLDAFLSNSHPDFYGIPAVELSILKVRKKRLATVKDPDLQPLKQQCVTAIDKNIEELRKIQTQSQDPTKEN
jgi:hypothetical protein